MGILLIKVGLALAAPSLALGLIIRDRSHVHQNGSMKPDELEIWSSEDRTALFRAVEYLCGDTENTDRIGLCLDTILNDLEAYDDPEQGLRIWLYSDEAPLLSELAERLHQVAGSQSPIAAGERAVKHAEWSTVREVAAKLVVLMRSNGKVAAPS